MAVSIRRQYQPTISNWLATSQLNLLCLTAPTYLNLAQELPWPKLGFQVTTQPAQLLQQLLAGHQPPSSLLKLEPELTLTELLLIGLWSSLTPTKLLILMDYPLTLMDLLDEQLLTVPPFQSLLSQASNPPLYLSRSLDLTGLQSNLERYLLSNPGTALVLTSDQELWSDLSSSLNLESWANRVIQRSQFPNLTELRQLQVTAVFDLLDDWSGLPLTLLTRQWPVSVVYRNSLAKGRVKQRLKPAKILEGALLLANYNLKPILAGSKAVLSELEGYGLTIPDLLQQPELASDLIRTSNLVSLRARLFFSYWLVAQGSALPGFLLACLLDRGDQPDYLLEANRGSQVVDQVLIMEHYSRFQAPDILRVWLKIWLAYLEAGQPDPQIWATNQHLNSQAFLRDWSKLQLSPNTQLTAEDIDLNLTRQILTKMNLPRLERYSHQLFSQAYQLSPLYITLLTESPAKYTFLLDSQTRNLAEIVTLNLNIEDLQSPTLQ